MISSEKNELYSFLKNFICESVDYTTFELNIHCYVQDIRSTVIPALSNLMTSRHLFTSGPVNFCQHIDDSFLQ